MPDPDRHHMPHEAQVLAVIASGRRWRERLTRTRLRQGTTVLGLAQDDAEPAKPVRIRRCPQR